jgi:hypothetical protein
MNSLGFISLVLSARNFKLISERILEVPNGKKNHLKFCAAFQK